MNALDFALKMEVDGERYYMEQAQLNENRSIKVVCQILAKDEHYHAQILRRKIDEQIYELKESDSYTVIKNLFKNIDNLKSEINETPTQLEFYRAALENEKKSIDLYTGLLENTEDLDEQNLFNYLIKQEKLHYSLLNELVTLLRHSEEWVESAEFGLRIEEY